MRMSCALSVPILRYVCVLILLLSLSLQPTHSAELARVVETLRSERDSLSKQLALAKDMLGKAGDISEQKIRLVEKK
jgi:hypothetical protein